MTPGLANPERLLLALDEALDREGPPEIRGSSSGATSSVSTRTSAPSGRITFAGRTTTPFLTLPVTLMAVLYAGLAWTQAASCSFIAGAGRCNGSFDRLVRGEKVCCFGLLAGERSGPLEGLSALPSKPLKRLERPWRPFSPG